MHEWMDGWMDGFINITNRRCIFSGDLRRLRALFQEHRKRSIREY